MNEARSGRINILKQFLREDQNDHFSRYALALEVMEIGQVDESIHLLEEVIRQNADFLPAYYQLGKAYEKVQKMEDAVRVYKLGIEIARTQKNVKTESELKSALFSLQEDDD